MNGYKLGDRIVLWIGILLMLVIMCGLVIRHVENLSKYQWTAEQALIPMEQQVPEKGVKHK